MQKSSLSHADNLPHIHFKCLKILRGIKSFLNSENSWCELSKLINILQINLE